MRKVLSVIIPTYNMERYLRNCLHSLIISDKQLLECLEVLIINDGSKDNSLSIAYEFESLFPKTFRVINKENGNYGSCVNRGLSEANGKYIKILDADDTFCTDNFLLFMSLLDRLDVDMVISSFNMINPFGSIIRKICYNLPECESFDSSLLLPETDMWMHAVAYKKDLLLKIDYHQTEGISYTDQEWIFLPVSAVREIYYFPNPVYNYLVGRNGQTIDKKVFAKNIWQEIKGLTVMSEEYYKLINGCQKYRNDQYLKNRIRARISAIYATHIYRDTGNVDIKKLFDLEQELKSNYPIVYAMCDELKFHPKIPIKYIKLWRKKHFWNPILFAVLRRLEIYIEHKREN